MVKVYVYVPAATPAASVPSIVYLFVFEVVDVLVRFVAPLYPPKLTANGTPACLAVKTNCPAPAPSVAFTATEPLALIKALRPFLMALGVLEESSPKVNISPLIATL